MKNGPFGSFGEWAENFPKERQKAYRLGIVDQLCKEMGWPREKLPNRYWTFERCVEEALKYKNTTEWVKASPSSYAAARRNGWLKECSSHFEVRMKPRGYWTKKRCQAEAKKFKTTTAWQRASGQSYTLSRQNGWLKEFTAHMIKNAKPEGYWTKERCKANAKKYKTKTEWTKFGMGAVDAARRNGWYEECTAHMKNGYKKESKFTLKHCKSIAKKYKRPNDWKQNDPSSYWGAQRNGVLKECTAHMKKRGQK